MFGTLFSFKIKTPSAQIHDDITLLTRAISHLLTLTHGPFWQRPSILRDKQALTRLLNDLVHFEKVLADKDNEALNQFLTNLAQFLTKKTATQQQQLSDAIKTLIQHCKKLDWHQNTTKVIAENPPDFLAAVNN